jgi:L-lactate dehydrogenase complex protein LldG
MNTQTAMVDLFKEKAQLVSAVVSEVSTHREAFEYSIDLCDRKEACQLMISGCDRPLSAKAGNMCDEKQSKIIAAPGLKESHMAELNNLAVAKDIQLITGDLRKHLAGIDIGLTFIDYGIAETGTLVLDSSSKEVRLVTMISEVHIALPHRTKLRQNAYALEENLK